MGQLTKEPSHPFTWGTWGPERPNLLGQRHLALAFNFQPGFRQFTINTGLGRVKAVGSHDGEGLPEGKGCLPSPGVREAG